MKLRKKIFGSSLISVKSCGSFKRTPAEFMPSVFKRPERPTGIIRSLPYDAESSNETVQSAYKKLLRSLRALNTDDDAWFFVGMAQKPTQDVLHMYIIASGRIIGRANIADWLTEQPPMMRLDQTVHLHKYWCVLSAPFVEPPEKILVRGFQGFRYVGNLW